jgi:hypothetical protein
MSPQDTLDIQLELSEQEFEELLKRTYERLLRDDTWCYVCDRPKDDCACVENGGTY